MFSNIGPGLLMLAKTEILYRFRANTSSLQWIVVQLCKDGKHMPVRNVFKTLPGDLSFPDASKSRA